MRIFFTILLFAVVLGSLIAQPCSTSISGSFSICNGEPATLTIIPIVHVNYTDIIWSTGETTSTINPTAPGTYSVTVTCDNGSTDTDNITINDSNEPSPTPGITPFCNNGVVSLFGDNGFAFYLWSTDQRSQSITIPSGGNYCLTVVDNSTGCAGEACIDVTIPVIQDIVITGNLLICNGESSTLTVEGNYSTYDWSNGQSGNPITVSQAGVYTVTVTDAGDCTGTGSVTVVESNNSVTIDGPDLLCGGSSGVLNSVPSNWQSYLWSTGENSPSITVTDAGIYAITVTDDLGCTSTNTLNLAAEPLPTVQFSVANPDVCSGECIEIQVNFTGTAPFQLTYTAFNLSFSETFSTNSGTIEVCVPPGNPLGPTSINAVSLTDAWCTCDQGCQGLGSIGINVEGFPVPEMVGDLAICDGQTTTYTVNGGPFNSYQWSNGATTSSIDVNTAGTYTVTVTNAAGCTGTDSQTLQVNNNPVASFSLQGSTSCGGSVTLTGTNGFSSYAWSTGETTQAITFSTSGTYTLTVTDANGCTDDATTILTFPDNIDVTISGSLAFCEGGSTTLSVNPTGLDDYSWSDGQNGQNIVVFSAGIYSVTATNSAGCIGTATVSISELPNPVPNITGPSVICEFQNANLNVTGGFNSYFWSNGETTDFINTSNPGTYTVTVTSSDGCTASTTFSLTVLPAPTPQITSSGSSCDGQVVLDAGSGYVNYSWSNAQSGNPITVNLTDNYAVTVTDNNGCTNNAALFVFIDPAPLVSITGLEQFCESESTTLEASPGFDTYLWSNGQSGAIITVNSPGVYSVTATDNFGCSDSEEITITVLPDPSAAISGPGTFCENQQAVLSASSGFSNYSWSNGESGANITVSNAGTYTVTITDNNGCTASATEMLDVLSIPQPNITASPYQCDGQILLDAGGGFNAYLWSNGAGGNPVTVNLSGNYSVVVTAANGCTNTDILFIDIPPIPSVSINGNNQICGGEITNLQASAGFNSYLWSTGQGGQSIEVSNSGNFSVTATDNFGCTATATLTVTDLPAPIPIMSGPTNTCSGQSVTLETQGGFNTYLWSTGEFTPEIMVNSAGTYSVTVTAPNGCTGVANQSLTVLPVPQPVISTSPYNCDAQLSLNAGSGFNSYLWSTGQTTQNISITQSGLYSVTVTQANGCTGSDVFSADIPALPSVQISGNATFCQGGSSVLVASTGFNQYIWSTGEVTQSITINQTGNYAVTVTDAFGCTDESIFSVQVLNNPTPVITGPTTICVGGQANFNVPGNFTDYAWSSGQNTPSITVLDPGVYSVTVTAANGCTGVDDQTLTVSNSLEPVIAELPYACNGQIDLDAGSGYLTYAWSSGQSTSILSVNASGDYSITVTDATGCVGTDVITVIIPPNPVVVISGASTICQNNSTLLEATPGFQSYLWSNNQVGPAITVGTAGVFSVVATDNFGCTTTSNFTVSVNPLPLATISGPAGICINSNGILSAPSGFSGYIWSTGETSNSISVNTAGIYTVTVTDANSCTNVGSASLVVTDALQPPITNQPYACDGQINLETDAGFATYVWNTGQNISGISVTQSGTYTVTVSDNNGCTGIASLVVDVPSISQVTVSGIAQFCPGGSSTLSASSGFVSYLWFNGSTDSTLEVNQSGIYTVTATDTLGCSSEAQISISELMAPQPQISGPQTVCPGNTADLTASSGFVAYQWSTGDISSAITVLPPTSINLTVTDANGCTGTTVINIGVSNQLTPQILIAQEACTLSALLDVGSGYQMIEWSNGATTQQINSTQPGEYSVTVSDAAGCSGEAQVSINFPVLPSLEISGDTQICPGGTGLLQALGTFDQYQWSTGANTNNISINQAGNYTLTVTDAAGCTAENSFLVETQPAPIPVISNPGVLCGDSALLSSTAGFASYTWSNGQTLSQISVSQPGDYLLTVTDVNGCTGVASVFLSPGSRDSTFIQVLSCDPQNVGITVESFTGSDGCDSVVVIQTGLGGTLVSLVTIDSDVNGYGLACPGDSNGVATVVPQGGQTPFQFQWSNGANTATISDLRAGLYTVTVTDLNGCSGTSTAFLAVPAPIVPVLQTINPSCFSPGTITIQQIEGGISPYTVQINPEVALTDGTTPLQFDDLSDGIFSVEITDANGCLSEEFVALTLLNAVNEMVGDTIEISLGETVTLNAPITINPLVIEWSGAPNLLSCDNCLNPSLSPLSTTELRLLVQGYGGCSAEGLYLIRVKSDEQEVYIPNIFTPNSDDLNNRFTVFGNERVVNIRSLQLYDRWGNLMVVLQDIQPNRPEQGWDGRFNGEPMGPGVYVYWTEVEFLDGSTAVYKGDLTLVR